MNDAQATEFSRGVAYIADQSEVNSQGSAASNRVMVTPKTLDARRSTEAMAGIVETATQAEVNAGALHNPYVVSPKTLHNRKSTETMWGLTEIGTQGEVDAGASDYHYITPKKFKTWLAYDHFTPVEVSGIRRSGNLWGKVTLDITVATESQRGTLEVATQAEANVVDSKTASDIHVITPKKLNARRATEGMAGIAEIATDTEITGKTDHTRIVTPNSLNRALTQHADFNMTETNYGTGHTATLAETWVGNTTAGSTKPAGEYDHNPFVVSPRGLNYALANYLPKTAKAVDSDKLDNLDSSQFLRSDVSDTMQGILTHTNKYDQKIRHTDGKDYGVRLLASGTDVYVQGGCASGSEDDQHRLNLTGWGGKYLDQFAVNLSGSENAFFQVGSNRYKMYHEGHKPTPAEVGSYSKSEADGRFVNVTGDTINGNLTIKANSSHIGLVETDSSNKLWTIELSTGSFAITESGVATQVTIAPGGVATFLNAVKANHFNVGATTVIESDAKINYNKLKSVPIANTSGVHGVTTLTDSLSNPSKDIAATASAIKVLKEMIDEKADITGSAMEDLKIKNWLQIGNVILRPNKSTKSLDFIWTDVL